MLCSLRLCWCACLVCVSVCVCHLLCLCGEVVVRLLQYVVSVDELVYLTELVASQQRALQIHAILRVHV